MWQTENENLIDLYKQIDDCRLCKHSHNELQHVFGIGNTSNPKYVLTLINPTYLNKSTKPGYEGWRFPFMGLSSLWNVLYKSHILSEETHRLIRYKNWGTKTSELIRRDLTTKGVYLTNIVKCTKPDPTYPDTEMMHYNLPKFIRELEILRPEYIIAFGLLPLEQMTGMSLKLSDYYSMLLHGGHLRVPLLPQYKSNSKVIPCYFPVGRGNPAKAVEILQRVIVN